MMKKCIVILFLLSFCFAAFAAPPPQVVKKHPNGMLALLEGRKKVLFLAGTPEEMGRAHGELLAADIRGSARRIMLVGAGFSYQKGEWFFDQIADAARRSSPYTPKRFLDESAAMCRAAKLPENVGTEINFFPEMFHCSGVAVRGAASAGGKVRHVRVLDYMRDIRLQDFAVLTVWMPSDPKLFSFLGVGYAGFIGTVTAMNEKGLAIGEMGGRGEGKLDGLPMSFLMRRIMEECETVDEAIALMRAQPLTCDYYYILSDRRGNLAGIKAVSGAAEPVEVLRPGVEHPELPGALPDVVYISGAGVRADTLLRRLKENYGKLDTAKLIEIIKRPVAMNSNLQNAVFEPETLDVSFADAGADTLACDEPYTRTNLGELIRFYRANAGQ